MRVYVYLFSKNNYLSFEKSSNASNAFNAFEKYHHSNLFHPLVFCLLKKVQMHQMHLMHLKNITTQTYLLRAFMFNSKINNKIYC